MAKPKLVPCGYKAQCIVTGSREDIARIISRQCAVSRSCDKYLSPTQEATQRITLSKGWSPDKCYYTKAESGSIRVYGLTEAEAIERRRREDVLWHYFDYQATSA